MQLAAPSLRVRLGAAACVLLATGLPAPAAAADAGATTQVDASALVYGEENRAQVVEPTARLTRLLADGQSLSAQFGIDVITGASPTGAMPLGYVPAGAVQTTTSPSGTVSTSTPSPSALPVSNFRDMRGALDLEWQKPVGRFTPDLGGHLSREKDYQSVGVNGKLSVDLQQRLTTLTVGYGYNHDDVFPIGGTRVGLSDGTTGISSRRDLKQVVTQMAGVSRVVTRRWLVGVNATRTLEDGYLTEPYKVVSLLDPVTGYSVGFVTEKRPGRRDRRDVLGTSVYQLGRDVIHSSYRFYWDDWGVRSSTFDLKVRHDLDEKTWLEPHVRFYAQTQARFFRFGLLNGEPLPDYATSDERLGALRTATVGATYGFRLPGDPGEWSVRAEYLAQFGNGHPKDVPGVQRTFDLFPTENIGSLVAAYSVEF